MTPAPPPFQDFARTVQNTVIWQDSVNDGNPTDTVKAALQTIESIKNNASAATMDDQAD
jgi:hypothetical protein